MYEFAAAYSNNVPQVIRRACASLSMGLKRIADGIVIGGFLSSASKLSMFWISKDFVASAPHSGGRSVVG